MQGRPHVFDLFSFFVNIFMHLSMKVYREEEIDHKEYL